MDTGSFNIELDPGLFGDGYIDPFIQDEYVFWEDSKQN